jgi:hypothetical protein
MANPLGCTAALYYDVGQWYNERDSSRAEVVRGTELRTYRFHISPGVIRRLRLDPGYEPTTVTLGAIRLLGPNEQVVDAFGPESVRPMHHIVSYSASGGIASARLGPDNPMLLIDRPLQDKTAAALGLARIGEPMVLAIAALVLGAVVFSVGAALRLLPGERAAPLFWATFLIVLGARLAWLKAYGRPMPYWDEWETDGAGLLIPLKARALTWGSLFIPQSEHRTLVSRLVTLAGAILGGEWDPRVAMVAGAAMFASALGLLSAACASLPLRLSVLASLALAVLGALPFDAHNLLCGDQCQMDALVLMAVTVLLLGAAPPTRLSLAAAAAASAVSVFTMASGFAAPLIAAAAVLWAPRATGGGRGALPHAAVFLAAAVAGLALYRPAPFQGPTYAGMASVFLGALEARMAWPLAPGLLQAALVWLPLALFGGTLLLRMRTRGPLDAVVLGLGAWALVNAAGLAHGRPLDASPFDNKYYTTMALAVVASGLGTLVLLSERRTRAAAAVAFIALSPALLSTAGLLARSPAEARGYWGLQASYDGYLRPYLRTGDRAILYDVAPDRLPYWNGAELAAQLDSPLMQPWLPAVLRRCLADRPGSPYRADEAPGWPLLLCRSAMKAGLLVAALGLALLGRTALRGPVRLTRPPQGHSPEA